MNKATEIGISLGYIYWLEPAPATDQTMQALFYLRTIFPKAGLSFNGKTFQSSAISAEVRDTLTLVYRAYVAGWMEADVQRNDAGRE